MGLAHARPGATSMNESELAVLSPYGELVGRRTLASDPERGTIEIEFVARHEFTNRIGTIAGGMVAGLLDSVTGLAANLGLEDGIFAVHATMTVEYHAPMSPGRIVGRGRVVERVDRDITSHGELYDASGQHLASADAKLRVIRAKAT